MLIKLEGADAALKALRQMEPLTAKEIGREVSSIGARLASEIGSAAPSGAPMSGWRQTSGARGSRKGAGWPGWSQIRAKSKRHGMSVVVSTSSATEAIAVMYESAGIQGGATKAGRQMVSNFDKSSQLVKSGRYSGRLARKAVQEDYPDIMKRLEKAANDAADAVNRLMP